MTGASPVQEFLIDRLLNVHFPQGLSIATNAQGKMSEINYG